MSTTKDLRLVAASPASKRRRTDASFQMSTPKAGVPKPASTPRATPRTQSCKQHDQFVASQGREPKRKAADTPERRLAIRLSQLPSEYKRRLSNTTSNAAMVLEEVLTFTAENKALPQHSKKKNRHSEKVLAQRFERIRARGNDSLSEQELSLLTTIFEISNDLCSLCRQLGAGQATFPISIPVSADVLRLRHIGESANSLEHIAE